MPETATQAAAPTRRPAIPPPLLDMVTAQALDADYREVARRRGRSGLPAPDRRWTGHWLAATAIAVFALMVVIAGLQTSRSAPATAANKARLVHSINDRRATVARLLSREDRLRTQNASLGTRRSELTDAEVRATSDRNRLRVRAGLVAVHGPGIRVSVTDAPGPRGVDRPGLVKDEDLGLLVNGLWEAGAEAISVNGQRLTAVDAIRNVGIVPQVDGVPLRSPFVVSAIGNEKTLEARLYQTTTGLQFKSTADYVGIKVSTKQADDLTIPAAPRDQLRLRSATPGGGTGKPPSDSAANREAGP